MDNKDEKQSNTNTPMKDVNLNVNPGTVIRNLNVPCTNRKLSEHFSDNIIALAFHKEISIVNLIYILHRCSNLESVHLDNVKLIHPEKEKKSTKKITLKFLKKMTISIINQIEGITESKPATLHADSLNFFKFIEMITFGSLEEVDITCTLDQLLTIPLPAAFVPNYTIQKADSLVEFLYNNRCTIKQLTIGPKETEKLFITVRLPHEVDKICNRDDNTNKSFDHTFRKMEEFKNREPTEFVKLITAHDHPLPLWWTSILEYQTILTHLSLTLMDMEVLAAALTAAERCCDTLTVLHLHIIGKDMHIHMRKLNKCSKLTTMSLTVQECRVSFNFDLLPENIKIFKISGILCENHSFALSKSLSNVQELTVCFNKYDYPDATNFSVVNWPVFENILDFLHLDFLVFESEHLPLNWDEIHEWSKSMEWCNQISHNKLEEIGREEILIHILPIALQPKPAPATELDQDLNTSGFRSFFKCFGF